jgi:hypothetical protein
LKYKEYQLDNDLLMKYTNMINNLDLKQYNSIFYMDNAINKNEPENILVINIENIIESYSIETKLLSKSDLCCSNIILLFSLSLQFLDESTECNIFLCSLLKNFTIFRKYISYITNMLYFLFSNYIKNNNYTRAHFYLILYYICINSIRELKLVPNESLMKIIKKFNELDLKKFDENFLNQNKNEIKDNSNNKVEAKIEERYKKEEISTVNLFPIYNFCKNKIFKEKEILDYLSTDSTIIANGVKIFPMIRYQNKNVKFETIFYNQIIILNKLIKEYNSFTSEFDEKQINYNLLVDLCMNILVYMRNFSEFNDLKEITDMVENIFFLFLNKIEDKK